MSGAVFPLQGNQRKAADPEESVWLSASAGTGKTQVLSARVLRLLLQPNVDPSQILCLTFTKAGAAEMAVRINSVLARWVRIDEGKLGKELHHLGASNDEATRDRARTLFASVLDCPGGGLRIDTIHAFSQWLLANFPNEAGLMPGMRAMEDREREVLAREVLADMLAEAERTRDQSILDAVAAFSRAKGPDAVQSWLMRCAKARRLWEGRRGWRPPMAPQVKQLLGLPSEASDTHIAEMCDDDTFDTLSLLRCKETLASWNTATGREGSAAIERWLASDGKTRADTIADLYAGLFAKTTDAPKQLNNILKRDPDYQRHIDKVQANIRLILDFKALLELAEFLAPALELGRAFWERWDEAKVREGLLDFDDLIERAAQLLSGQVAGDWIRYKLDRRFDHILVDEAQDTNAAQWEIIDALIDDFFAGEGAAGHTIRTIFAVGDYKQAIFGFQGTSPENFRKARERVREAMHVAVQGAVETRSRHTPRELETLDLGQSFRTAKPVLEFVDRAIDAIGSEALGVDTPSPTHVGEERPGLVTLWNPVTGGDGNGDGDRESEDGEEGWLSRHDRAMADKIASQVARWTQGVKPFALAKGEHRNARPGDIMVLVRSRKELAGLIVARLHAKGVPVAGVDRLRLGAPLVVKDLMSALRFAAQPLDDLELANLLSSPLVGWSQEDLLAHVPREDGRRLWQHLRESNVEEVRVTIAKLRELLALADFETPQTLLQWLLVGPWQGRSKLVARLGREANDPIDELLNAAFAYEGSSTPSLAGFIRWFDAGEGEIKRDPDDAPDLVRVMTVHGAKGLQAPIVIMADATSKPGQTRDLELPEELPGSDSSQRTVPLPSLRASERKGRVEQAYQDAQAAELQEHWRLLYVAMTRAEEALFIGGSLNAREKAPNPDSWYARLEPLFGDDRLEDDLWLARAELGERAEPAVPSEDVTSDAEKAVEPEWLRKPIGPEPRPPRPLAPSSAGEEQGSDPPLAPDQAREAARRGVLIHALLERLPDVEVAEREERALAWLKRQASDFDAASRREMFQRANAVLSDSEFAEVFAPGVLAEVPLSAVVGGQVVAGTADRLLVTSDKVTVVDFKTARRPPAKLEDIPHSTLKQMAAYTAVLEVIYPEREICAAILYTQTPQIFALPQELIKLHKNAFQSAQ